MDAEMREKTGQKAVILSVSGKIALTIFNFIVGILSGSTALIVESAHTFSDIMTSAIAFIGFKIGLRPPDKEHPYGHGRAEPLMGLAIVLFLIIIAYEIFSEVYTKVTLGVSLTPPSYLAAVMALVGVGANFALTSYSMKVGKKVNSPAIIADANHQKVDIFACVAILVGVIGAKMGFPILDPIVAFFIGLMVLKTALDVFKDNIDNIMGKIPSEKLLTDVKSAALSVVGVYDAHDIRINYMGPCASAELHIEVGGDLALREAHKLSHKVEKNIIENVDVVTLAIVHVCPVGEDEVVVSKNDA
ncbi:cation diffusion facilitator family transporter [Methanobacterium paludis]|uniref:Cation diffusion facilitator family transporter n=1 Tax=Methanobacterium paludis (strain DSM 25820 / JCM 18151 / SWAN1) TaxID=868131 RepID=F6D5E8_METPW|nr:cation diffusion facilitator family transporter [Methanobacterium paludis]AEG19300.1 cation diffusion facilitator family transporter [Methanobacterium paludis]